MNVDEQPQKTVVKFATFDDVSFVEKWRETLGTTPEAIQREAADLAQLARERYLADSRVGQHYMTTSQDLHDHIARDPECEVAGLILLKCEWFAESQIIGLCHFRRTWCNNIVVDYLAKHPLTFSNTGEARYRITGIGPVLLCFLSRIAKANACDIIWGEATHISHGFYKKFFALKEVKDLFVIPSTNYTACAERKLDWQVEDDANTISLAAVKDLYQVEEVHPPLVGSRAFIVGSNRQLVNHFMDLPRNLQDEIAKSLSLFEEGDDQILEDQWCGVVFQRARQSSKLHALWNEVEKRHEHGEPERNPFGPE